MATWWYSNIGAVTSPGACQTSSEERVEMGVSDGLGVPVGSGVSVVVGLYVSGSVAGVLVSAWNGVALLVVILAFALVTTESSVEKFADEAAEHPTSSKPEPTSLKNNKNPRLINIKSL